MRAGKGSLQLESQVRKWGRTSAENVPPQGPRSGVNSQILNTCSTDRGQRRKDSRGLSVQTPLFHEGALFAPGHSASLV